MADFYLLNEDGSKLLLENLSGALLLDSLGTQTYWNGGLAEERGKIYVDSWQMGFRDNPTKLRW